MPITISQSPVAPLMNFFGSGVRTSTIVIFVKIPVRLMPRLV
jgi:hypothetical protein